MFWVVFSENVQKRQGLQHQGTKFIALDGGFQGYIITITSIFIADVVKAVCKNAILFKEQIPQECLIQGGI